MHDTDDNAHDCCCNTLPVTASVWAAAATQGKLHSMTRSYTEHWVPLNASASCSPTWRLLSTICKKGVYTVEMNGLQGLQWFHEDAGTFEQSHKEGWRGEGGSM